MQPESLHALALAAWRSPSPADKLARVERLHARLPAAGCRLGEGEGPAAGEAPGRPARPVLVPPAGLARRGLGSVAGRAAFFHALAHIELTAVNLALDAALRFAGLPPAYYGDWIRVAAEEAQHFQMLCGHLDGLGCAYGDLPAHGGLWEAAAATEDDPLRRMALVPRVHEARGLDVSPAMIARLAAAGDAAGARILERILEEEVEHVRIGSRWFAHLCAERGLAPGPTFISIVRAHCRERVRGPLNEPDRRRAGFSDYELRELRR